MNFFSDRNITDSYVSRFVLFPVTDGTPFPLNQSTSVKVTISLSLVFILCFGVIVRRKIFKYLQTVDCKKNPINYFVWLDQLNGGFLGLNVIFYIVTILLPFPLSDLIGYEVCNWADLFGCFYLAGSTNWGWTIALIRYQQ